MAEVGSFLNVDQFITGHSAYECVAYSAALVYYAGQPGKSPTGTTTQASNLAQQWYAKEEGSNDAGNTNGMGLDEEYNMLAGMGLHYQALAATIAAIKTWLQKGFPVLLCGAESGFHDLDLGDAVPYSWTPSGNHCIVATGIASDGNLLVHDCASIAPSGVRPGPRRYDNSKMQIVSATAVAMRWQGGFMKVPQGWKDANNTLTAPNGHKVVLGFRDHILNYPGGWHAGNQPLEEEWHADPLEVSNSSLGAGQKQGFNETTLEYTAARGVFEAWQGQEIVALRALLAKAGTGTAPVDTSAVEADINAIVDAVAAPAAKALADLKKL